MANKVWTPEQREAAADILEREESLYWSAETYLRPKHIADNGMDNLMHVLLEKQCELSEVTAERDRMDRLINTPSTKNFLASVELEAAHQVLR